jgi:hypothetical protein
MGQFWVQMRAVVKGLLLTSVVEGLGFGLFGSDLSIYSWDNAGKGGQT